MEFTNQHSSSSTGAPEEMQTPAEVPLSTQFTQNPAPPAPTQPFVQAFSSQVTTSPPPALPL